jgi:hypothetical protein
MRPPLLLAVALLVPAVGRADDKINEKIAAFCKENLNKKVGDGDCYDLAKYALAAAGAKPEFKYKNHPAKGDYVWGEEVVRLEVKGGKQDLTGKLKEIKAGDVIQFRDTKFGGPKASGKGTYSLAFSHHTAVVSEVKNGGKTLAILHQNMGGKKEVLAGSLTLEHLTEGWIRVYRPNPK